MVRKALVAVFFIPFFLFAAKPRQQPPPSQLDQVLQKAGEYSEKLKGMALNFVCHEKIKETINEFRNSAIMISSSSGEAFQVLGRTMLRQSGRNSFLYDYQLIKRGESLSERRNLLEENGKSRDEKDVPLKTQRWSAKYLVYGAYGFFGLSWQPRFQYEILGSERVSRKRALIVRASPKEITPENYCFGRLWIDEADGSVLQIEWEPASIAGFQDTVQTPAGEMKRSMIWTVTYDVVHNGIRFPGAQTITEIYVDKRKAKHTKYEAEYKFINYKFFTVETEVIFK